MSWNNKEETILSILDLNKICLPFATDKGKMNRIRKAIQTFRTLITSSSYTKIWICLLTMLAFGPVSQEIKIRTFVITGSYKGFFFNSVPLFPSMLLSGNFGCRNTNQTQNLPHSYVFLCLKQLHCYFLDCSTKVRFELLPGILN